MGGSCIECKALALIWEVQANHQLELRIIIMSAPLQGDVSYNENTDDAIVEETTGTKLSRI